MLGIMLYQSVCPFVQIGSAPITESECVPHPWNQRGGGGGNTSLGVRGGGANSDDWRESLAHRLLCAVYTV
jgi:hypothetical protein